MTPPLNLAVDARMIRHSGIGVVLRHLLRAWAEEQAGELSVTLCGDPALLEPGIPAGLPARVIRWTPPVYSLRAALSPPRLPRGVGVWYSPHYATCLRTGLPMVCHVQDLLHITHPSRRGTATYMGVHLAALRRRAAHTLVTTRHVKVQLQTLHGFPPSRVLLTGLGPGEVGEYAGRPLPFPAAVRAALDGEARYLFASGILKPHKNWEFLLARLAANDSVTLPLVCAGLNGHEGELRAMARRHGLGDRVVTLPPLPPEELAAVYRHCAAFVYPSIAEGFGLPLLEALVMGAPAVHANLSPMREIALRKGHPFNPDWPQSFDGALESAIAGGAPPGERHLVETDFSGEYSWRETAAVTLSALRGAAAGVYPDWHRLTPPDR